MSDIASHPAADFLLQLYALDDPRLRRFVGELAQHVSTRTDSIDWWAATGQLLRAPVLQEAEQRGAYVAVEAPVLQQVFATCAHDGGKVDEASLYIMRYSAVNPNRELTATFDVMALEVNSAGLDFGKRSRDYTADEMLEKIAQAERGHRRAYVATFRPAFSALHLPFRY